MDNPDTTDVDDRADTGPRAVILPPAADDDAALVPLRFRFDGWTATKQRQFLAALGETGCVRDACRAVGRSNTSAYRLRARSDAFAAEWDCALAMAATVLEQVAFQRAVLGVEEPVWHYGKYLGTRRRYSDGLLRLLILRGDVRAGLGKTPEELVAAAQDAARAAGGYFGTRASAEETNAQLRKQLDALGRRLKRERREKDEAAAVRLLAAGACP